MANYLMEAVNGYTAGRQSEFDADIWPATGYTTQSCPGLSYDPIRREIVFSVCWALDLAAQPNPTAFALWDGLASIAAGAFYDPGTQINFAIARLNIDTRLVTVSDPYDATSTVPSAVFGDGTARRFVASTASGAQGPKLVDPRSDGGAWVHVVTDCKAYNFRRVDDYKLTLSPFIADGTLRSFHLLGITDDWAYIGEQAGAGHSNQYTVELIPRVRTAPETAADYLLSYASFEFPLSNTHRSGSTVIMDDGKMLWFVLNTPAVGAWSYALYKFTPPTSAPFGGPVVGGGWSTVTPWAAGTGPNTLVADWHGDNEDDTALRAMWLRDEGVAALVNCLYPGKKNPVSTDPADYHLQCSYFKPADASWSYTGDFVTGYMTSAWAMTADPNAAAFAVRNAIAIDSDPTLATGIRFLNTYYDYHTYDFAGLVSGQQNSRLRWWYFEVNPVSGGVVDTATVMGVKALYQFANGVAPALQRFITEAGWDAAYTAYGTAIGDPKVVQGSMQEPDLLTFDDPQTKDQGLYDPVTDSFWWSGLNFNFDLFAATYAPRQAQNVSPPFLRLAIQTGPPLPSPGSGAVSVWSHIGSPQLKKNRHPSPTPTPPVAAPTVTLSLPNLTGSVNSASPASASAGPVAATAHGGQSPITWGWQINSGAFSLSSSTDHASVSQVLAAGALSAGSIRATATDGLGHTGSADINVYLANTYAPTPPVPPLTPPLIGPSVAWTGTAGSGGTAPVDPPRTTAKPVLQSYTPSHQRLTENTVYVFDADALGGVASVEVWLEGATQTVLRSLYTDTDVNGQVRQRDGYAVTVDVVGAAARHSTGAAMNMYATATANDGTMQKRVIGPIVIFPRNTPIAWQKTVNPGGGGDYTTLVAAQNALRAATPESARITFAQTASYELGTPATPGAWTGHTGYVVYDAAPGVIATLIRGNAFDPLNAVTNGVNAWEWWPWTGPIEFRGAGVVLDTHNWNSLRVSTADPHWFNGCGFINSAGARDVTYWNRAPPPAFTISNFFNVVPCYFTDGDSRYVGFDSAAASMMVGWRQRYPLGVVHGELCTFVSDCDELGADPRAFTVPRNAIAVTYTGAGVATIVADPSAGGTLDCKVNGTSVGGVFPISLGNNPAATYFTMANVAAAITAIASGNWAASVTNNALACWTLAQRNFTYTVTTATPLTAFIDYHTEWVKTNTPNVENLLYQDTTVRRAYYTTSITNTEHGACDAIMRNVAFDLAAQPFQNGSWAGSHVVMDNVVHDAPFALYPSDAYSAIRQCVFSDLGLGQGVASLPSFPVLANNIKAGAWPAGTPAGNLTVADYAAYSALVLDKANGDFRPANGPLTANLAARIDLYDGRLNLRAASEARGAWAIGYGPPIYLP